MVRIRIKTGKVGYTDLIILLFLDPLVKRSTLSIVNFLMVGPAAVLLSIITTIKATDNVLINHSSTNKDTCRHKKTHKLSKECCSLRQDTPSVAIHPRTKYAHPCSRPQTKDAFLGCPTPHQISTLEVGTPLHFAALSISTRIALLTTVFQISQGLELTMVTPMKRRKTNPSTASIHIVIIRITMHTRKAITKKHTGNRRKNGSKVLCRIRLRKARTETRTSLTLNLQYPVQTHQAVVFIRRLFPRKIHYIDTYAVNVRSANGPRHLIRRTSSHPPKPN